MAGVGARVTLGDHPGPARAHAAARKRLAVVPQAKQHQVSAAVVPPQPPPPSIMKAPPPWAVGASMVAVAAAALRLAWSNYRRPILNPPFPFPPGAPAPVAAADRVASSPPSPASAVQQAGQHLAVSIGSSPEAAAGAMAPLLLAAETGGAVDETATMTLEQLQQLAKELYLLIQQMQLQLQEVVSELAELLPEASQAQLDEVMQQMETVEERLAVLKGQKGAEEGVMAAEHAYTDLQWRLFELVTAGAAERERRTLRSLLFNLTTQRQLLRQVEQQEALRLRMRDVEQNIAVLLDMDGEEGKEQKKQGVAVLSSPSPQRSQDAAAPPDIASQRVRASSPPLSGTALAAGVPGQLRLAAAGISIPHVAKAATGGEDAFLLSSYGLGAIGVADGVGGWAAEGVDPSLYPRRFMAACHEVLAEREEERQRQGVAAAAAALEAEAAAARELGGTPVSLKLLEEAYRRTEEPGSSTAILGCMLPGGRLSVAHLGDCELKVVRDGRIVFATRILEHQWNMPLQLSCPDFYDCGSRPADADVHEVEVAPGDVVVAGSDGLWDNLWDEQVLEAVAVVVEQQQQQQGGTTAVSMAEQLAQLVAQAAYRQSIDPDFRSPFAVERQRRAAEAEGGGLLLSDSGGKQDDITAVVAVVVGG